MDNNRRAFAGEKVEGEVALSFGGEERFYYNIIAPIRDGEELLGILGVNIDITERKRAENALQKAHDELNSEWRSVLRNWPKQTNSFGKATTSFRPFMAGWSDGLLIADLETMRSARANASMCRMIGYSEADILSLSQAEIHPRRRSCRKCLERIRCTGRGAGIKARDEIRLLRKDGERLVRRCHSSRIIYRDALASTSLFET